LILGGTDRDLYPGFDTAVDRKLLDGFIAAAVKRIPVLENAEIKKIYVGIRSITPDYNGILGETNVKGFYCAGGFSGHGFMHAPAVGVIMAALITEGDFPGLDLSPLSPVRFNGVSGSRGSTGQEKIVF